VEYVVPVQAVHSLSWVELPAAQALPSAQSTLVGYVQDWQASPPVEYVVPVQAVHSLSWVELPVAQALPSAQSTWVGYVQDWQASPPVEYVVPVQAVHSLSWVELPAAQALPSVQSTLVGYVQDRQASPPAEYVVPVHRITTRESLEDESRRPKPRPRARPSATTKTMAARNAFVELTELRSFAGLDTFVGVAISLPSMTAVEVVDIVEVDIGLLGLVLLQCLSRLAMFWLAVGHFALGEVVFFLNFVQF
jgi:hypothetical protein